MNKIFLIEWIDNTTSICEGTDVFNAIDNHLFPYYRQFYLTHKEIKYEN